MIFLPEPIDFTSKKETPEQHPNSLETSENGSADFVSGIIRKTIGEIIPGRTVHYWSYGNFNMMRLIFYILNHIGAADILMSSYSISPKTIEGIINRREKGLIKSFRLIVDNRVRSISPKPFDMIVRNFDYRCTSIHAKVACIWNQNYKITVISSQNATDNPKAERGIIFSDPEIFDFDFKNLTDAYNIGTT